MQEARGKKQEVRRKRGERGLVKVVYGSHYIENYKLSFLPIREANYQSMLGTRLFGSNGNTANCDLCSPLTPYPSPLTSQLRLCVNFPSRALHRRSELNPTTSRDQVWRSCLHPSPLTSQLRLCVYFPHVPSTSETRYAQMAEQLGCPPSGIRYQASGIHPPPISHLPSPISSLPAAARACEYGRSRTSGRLNSV